RAVSSRPRFLPRSAARRSNWPLPGFAIRPKWGGGRRSSCRERPLWRSHFCGVADRHRGRSLHDLHELIQAPAAKAFQIERDELEAKPAQLAGQFTAKIGLAEPWQIGQRHLNSSQIA